VATLGKNAITDDCILKTHLHAKANYQAMCDNKRKKSVHMMKISKCRA
jgi:hypothetical protein